MMSGIGLPSAVTASRTQGSTPSASPPHICSGMATGTSPSASTASCVVQPMVTRRAGFCATTVSPKAWVKLTG